MKFEITQELAQAILDYLVQRPFREVTVMINAMQKLKPIEDGLKGEGDGKGEGE